MPLFNMTDLRAGLPLGQRLIGIDPGSRTIGLALTDVTLTLASPYASIRRGRLATNAAEIVRLARQENAGGLVVGLPLMMDGSVGPAAQAARDWAHALSAASGLPAAMWDERMTSATVHRMLIEEADMGRARRASVVDRMAAAVMLQAALEGSRQPPAATL